MKILFLLKTGATIEWPVPDALAPGFQFTTFCGNIVISGFFQCENMHLKYEDMQGMLFTSENIAMPEVQGMTKQ